MLIIFIIKIPAYSKSHRLECLAFLFHDYMGEIEKLTDPHSRGKGLTSNLSGLWRYRVGDYRVISVIGEGKTDEEPPKIVITVLVVHIGHRSKVCG